MILITGGTGFIGSVLVKYLNDRGHKDILVVDHIENGEKWLTDRGLKFAAYAKADGFLTSKYLKDKLVKSIYHMGACSSTTEMNIEYLKKNNVDYTKNLIEYSLKTGAPICYASSAATYGAGENGYSDDDETTKKLKPLNPYGDSKQIVDEWMLNSATKKPAQWYGVKFFNVFGPNEYHKGKMTSVVYQSFHQINKTGEVKLFKSYKEGYKDGEQKRDFVYVKDVCKAMVELMEKKAPSGIYNLGTGHARTWKDLVNATFKAMNKESKIAFIEMPDNLKNQYQYFTEAKMDKLFKALPGFKFMSLEEAVDDYVKNHLMKESHLMNESR